MSQYDFGTINTATTTGGDLATLLQNWRDAVLSSHVGTTRPTYVKAGQIWINNTTATNWVINLYDGATDIVLGYVNTTDDTAGFLQRADVTTKTASASISITERNMTVGVTASTANLTMTLPAATTAKNGFKINFQKRDNTAFTVSIARAGSDLINGAASVTLTTQWDTVELVCDGVSSWYAYGGVTDGSITAAKLAANSVNTTQIVDASVTAAKLAASVVALLIPTATVLPFAGGTTPANFLLCYGQAVSRTTYAALYAALGGAGSPYGQGDGTTTFNVPDLRGRVIAGKDNMGGTSASRLVVQMAGGTLGAVGGAESHTLLDTQLPAHKHNIIADATSTNLSVGAITASNQLIKDVNDGSSQQNYSLRAAGAAATLGLSSNPTVAGGQPHNIVQPTMIVNYIIKT